MVTDDELEVFRETKKSYPEMKDFSWEFHQRELVLLIDNGVLHLNEEEFVQLFYETKGEKIDGIE